MKTKSLLLATALLMSTSALAQKNTFKGVVLDDLGEPVIGATVQVKGVKGTSYRNTKLKKGATYRYKVRAYKTVNKKNYYGAFSNTTAIKVK